MTLILPECITGFSYGDCPAPGSDQSLFEKICLDFATERGGTCFFILGDGVTPNYHQANIKIGDQTIYVLLSKIYPVIGISKYEPFSYEYIDVPELIDLFPAPYQVPTATELNERFDVTLQPFLSDVDRMHIESWNPETIGNVIFHYWD